jgi:hypothetical protein
MNGSNIPPRDQFALGIKAFNDIIVGKYYIIESPAPTLTKYVGKVIEKTDDHLIILYDDDYQETLLREQINGGTIYPTRYTFYAPYPRPTGGTRRRQQRRRKSRRAYSRLRK